MVLTLVLGCIDMLYVCNIGEPVFTGFYFEREICIADTDDNKKEAYMERFLQSVVQQYPDIEINGLTLDPVTREIQDISVYTPQRSTEELKLEMLTGLSIKTDCGVVMNINAGDYFTGDLSVRLSDYGSKCSSRILQYFKPASGILTLVLDDKIKVAADTFDSIGSRSVIVDVRSVTNAKMLELIYIGVLANFGFEHMCRDYILDDEDRLELYLGLFCISKYYTRHSLSTIVVSQFRDISKVSKAVGDYMYPKFKRYIPGDLIVRRDVDIGAMHSLVSSFKDLYIELSRGDIDFSVIKSFRIPVFRALRCLNVNNSMYNKLFKYIEFFSGTEECRELLSLSLTKLASVVLSPDAAWNRR